MAQPDADEFRRRRRSSSESGDDVLETAQRDAEKEQEDDIEITPEVLEEKAKRDAKWANLTHSFAPTFLLGPIIPAGLGLVLIVVNSIVLRTAETRCVQPLPEFLQGVTALSWLLVFAVANQLIGPCPIISITGNLVMFNVLLGFAFLWALIGVVWISLGEPCTRSSPVIYDLASFEVFVLVAGFVFALITEVEWCIRFGCSRTQAAPRGFGGSEEDDGGRSEEEQPEEGGAIAPPQPTPGNQEPESPRLKKVKSRGAGAITAVFEDGDNAQEAKEDDQDEDQPQEEDEEED